MLADHIPPPPLLVTELPAAGVWYRCLIRPARNSGFKRPFPPPSAAVAIRGALFPDNTQTFLALQMWRLHEDGKADVLARMGASWNPNFGVGVWLDEGPPALWTAEEFMRLPPGSRIRPPIWTVIAVNPAAQSGAVEVWHRMAGSGVLLEFSVNGSLESYLRENLAFFREWIQEGAIRSQPFFVPLVRGNTFDNRAFSSLESRFQPVETYLRESSEDEALLVVSRQPILPRIGRLGPLDREPSQASSGISYRLTLQPNTR